MADAKTKNLAYIRKMYPEIAEALEDHKNAINNIGQQVNAAPVGRILPPPKHTAVSATGGGGVLDIKVMDTSPAYPGYERFADVSPDASFSKFHTIHMGATTNWRGPSPVPGTAHIRTYSQYPTSDISEHLYHPTPVDTSSGSTAATQSGDTVSGYGSQAVGNIKR